MRPLILSYQDRLEEQYMQVVYDPDERDRMYVYRVESGKLIKPPVYKGRPFKGLENWLREEHDGGLFQVLIRRGEPMLVSRRILICPLPSRKAAFEAFKIKYGW
jgi:hypothetical protein